ncbi:MAG: methyltransferase domain-containing protein [Candidatus Bilamarchaeaceae archaeon]
MQKLREYLREKDGVYFIDDKNNLYYEKGNGEVVKLSLFRDHFYNIRIYNKVPVLEIDGLRMQVMKGFKTPHEYSEKVIKNLGIKKKSVVLDTCMGLGYTALAAAKSGAIVFTIEYSSAVIELAKYCPQSKEIFKNDNVRIINGDASQEIKNIDDGYFDFVIHDPPRFTHAPQLYSLQFYKELKRVMKKRGRLYHYVGSVGANRKRRNIGAEITMRLSLAGFIDIKRDRLLQGIFAKA